MPAVVQASASPDLQFSLREYSKLAALPPNPMPIHKLLQLESVVSPTLQHPQHLSVSLLTPLPQHSLPKAMPDAWSKLLPKFCPLLPLFLLLVGRL